MPEQQGRVASPTSTKLGMMGAMHCLCQDICNNDYTSLFLLTVFQQSRRSCVTSSQYINNQVVKQPIRHTRLLSNSHTHTHTNDIHVFLFIREQLGKVFVEIRVER